MSNEISAENEQFIQEVVAAGLFPNRTAALDEAVDLLKRRKRLLDHIDEGTRQLRGGEAIELDDEQDLRVFFDDIKARGRLRDEATKKAP